MIIIKERLMNAIVKKGWDRAGQTCLVLGSNVFVEQWWTPVKWPDEEDPDFYKFAALIFEEADNSACNQQTHEAITLLRECATINGQFHRQEWFIRNKNRINAVIA